MSLNRALAEKILIHRDQGMAPREAVAALTKSESAGVGPRDLSAAQVAVFEHRLNAAELALILHQLYPMETALGIARTILESLHHRPEKGEMYNALTQAGFPIIESQAAVNILYPATGTIRADQAWQSTGVIVTGTQVTTLVCDGKWTQEPAKGECGPDGNPKYIALPYYTLPGVHEGAVIGRIGDNPLFLVGASAAAPAGQSGELSLCINDDLPRHYGAGLTDNRGSMKFTVTTAES
jgi:hypothetical protein